MEEKLTTDTFEAPLTDVTELLKELFYFSPPHKIREHLLEVFFAYLIELQPQDYPANHHEIVEDYYFLVTFLTKMDNLNEFGKSKDIPSRV
jgi:hypothetical protein